MTTNTKLQLEKYLYDITVNLDVTDMSVFCTTSICQSLYLSRTLTSQYLNELSKENKVVKINSRPVYYVSSKALEELLNSSLTQLDFLSIEEFIDYLTKEKDLLRDFSKAIGNNDSLEYCIDQMKSAILYPPNGLHVLLHGKKGSGKRYLVQLLYEFACNHKIFSHAAQFMEIEVKKNNQSAIHQLLDEDGYFHTLPEGLLYIYNAENMDSDFQERLQEQLLKISASKLQRPLRIVLGINHDVLENMQDSLQYAFPLKCKVPSYNERSLEEKEDFILRFFKKEQDKLQCKIMISSLVFQVLLHSSYINGIMELKSSIKNACANAYAQKENNPCVVVRLLHLPMTMLEHSDCYQDIGASQEKYYTLSEFRHRDDRERILSIFEDIMHQFSAYKQQEITFNDLMKQSQFVIRKYYDYLVFDSKITNVRYETFSNLLEKVLGPILKDSEITVPQNCIFVLAHILLADMKYNSGIHLWMKDRWQDIQDCLNILMEELPLEYALTQSVSTMLFEKMEFRLNGLNQIFMILNINFYNRDLDSQKLHGIILSHGYCTASSIVEAVNQLLERNVFEAIDMPLNMTFQEIENELNHYIELHPRWKSLILMVDMGSLEEIGKHVHANIKVGVLNNISTGTALEVGTQILQNRTIEEILPSVCEHTVCRYQLIQPQKKEKAILFTNDAGIEISRRLADLFRTSLPKNVNIKFMEYDFMKLMNHGEKDTIFDQYDILLIIKPHHLNLKYYPCVELEDIINFKEIHKVDEALQNDLDKEEIQIFNELLLKNFSLQNIMENLTILNPRKLLDFVSVSINELQRRLQIKFQSKTIVGIYIHVSLLVERLVTNHPIDYVGDLEPFMLAHKDFIQTVQDSFEIMLKDYNILLPMSEIYYLYNYIASDIENRKEVI